MRRLNFLPNLQRELHPFLAEDPGLWFGSVNPKPNPNPNLASYTAANGPVTVEGQGLMKPSGEPC